MVERVMVTLRLTCEAFYVDVRVRELNGRLIASADTPDGPTLGIGWGAVDAIANTLAPFDGSSTSCWRACPTHRADRRMASCSPLYQHGARG